MLRWHGGGERGYIDGGKKAKTISRDDADGKWWGGRGDGSTPICERGVGTAYGKYTAWWTGPSGATVVGATLMAVNPGKKGRLSGGGRNCGHVGDFWQLGPSEKRKIRFGKKKKSLG